MTSGLETEWDYSGGKGRDGQKKKIGKANEKRKGGKAKKSKNEVNDQGEKEGRGCSRAMQSDVQGLFQKFPASLGNYGYKLNSPQQPKGNSFT